MRKLLLFLLMSIAIGLTGCLRDDDDTVALPIVSSGVVPDEIKYHFYGHIPIYEGIDPPDITGKYLLHINELAYTSDYAVDLGHQYGDYYISFQEQTARGDLSYSARQASSVESSDEVHVVGSGRNFTAYFIANSSSVFYHSASNSYYIVKDKSAYVYSGTVTDEGIEDLYGGWVVLEKEDSQGFLVPVNTCRVFRDRDGFSERNDWSKSVAEDTKSQSTMCTKFVN